MNVIILASPNINKLNKKRNLEPYNNYIKLKINQTGKINILENFFKIWIYISMNKK